MSKIEAYEGVHLIIEFLVASLTEAREELRKAKLQQPDSAHQAACSLATRVFKKHFSKDVEYASGKVTWCLCDTTAGVISQIDNMVCGLVEPAAQALDDGCPHGSKHVVHDCIRCGAPVCCGKCCAEDAQALDAQRLTKASKDISTVLRVEGMDLEIGSRKLLKEAREAIDAAIAAQKGNHE